MKRRYSLKCPAALAVVATALTAMYPSDASAGATETWSITLPGPEFFPGAIHLTGIGPPSGSTIVNTTFDITFVADGTMPAADLAFHVGAQVDGGFAETEVFGTDLGFTSGPGTFTGIFATTALNGVTWTGFLPFPIIDIEIGSVNIPPAVEGGYLTDSFIIFDYVPAPEPGSLCVLAAGAAGLLLRRRKAI